MKIIEETILGACFLAICFAFVSGFVWISERCWWAPLGLIASFFVGRFIALPIVSANPDAW